MSMKTNLVARGLAVAVVVAALVFAWGVGHRQGRGEACAQIAANTKAQGGRSIQSLLLSRPHAEWDHSFWGTHCTLTAAALIEGGGRVGGRWRYDMTTATLYADDDSALALLPAAGRWQPSRQ